MKKNPIISFAVLMFLLLCPVYSYAQEPEIMTKGMWMWGSTLGSEGTKAIVEKLRSNYVNRVFLLVKGGGGTKTSATTLNEFITEAHYQGIEVHLWYCVLEDNMYLLSNPDAHMYHCPKPGTNNNNPYPLDDNRVNLLYPGYKKYVLDGISYFLNNFDCDGIHLDYIRYPHLTYSFDQDHLTRADSAGCNTTRLLNLFLGDYDNMSRDGFINLYSKGDTDVVKWVNMRKNVVHEYIHNIRDLIDSLKPGLKLSASFMPEGAINRNLADTHYAQNYSLNSPLLDEICPMSYFKSYDQATSWLLTVTKGALAEVSKNCRITAGYQTFDNVTVSQLKEQLLYALKAGADGLVGFRYGTTSSSQWTVIREKYKAMDPQTMTNIEVLDACSEICDSMNIKPSVPDSVYTDSTHTSFISAADFYYAMVNYLRAFSRNNKPPVLTAIVKTIAGPENPAGVWTENQIQLADIFNLAVKDAEYIDSAKVLPDFINADTVNYNPAAMFWVYARTINWYKNNNVMPNYATVKQCTGPETWTYGDITSVEYRTENIEPGSFELMQNFPNPFNPSTRIQFNIDKPGYVSLKVIDVLGNEIETLVNGEMSAGLHNIMFDAGQLASGIYFCRLENGSNSSVKKMLLIR